VKASRESQEKLLALQNIDSSLIQLTHKVNNLPVAKSLESKSQELLATRDLKVAAETEASDVKHELSRCEVDVEQVVSRIERDEKRLSAGQGTPKELEQLQHELASLNKRRAELEEVELEVMVRLEALNDRIKSLLATVELLDKEVLELRNLKEREEAELMSASKKNKEDRKSLASAIDPELLALYEKIRSSSDGIGAARLNGSQCEGCHLTMNAAEVTRVKALADDEVVRCEECRRILIRVG
jgi:predicted  nucleic acid-binding Zn-ribbon protein